MPALVRLQEIQVLPDAHQNFPDLPPSILLTFSSNKIRQAQTPSLLAPFPAHTPSCLQPDAMFLPLP